MKQLFDKLIAAGRGPKQLVAGNQQQILHIKAPLLPQFRFEWHPGKQRVYMIRLGVFRTDSKTETGEPIALHIETHGQAENAVLTFLRGYRAATAPEIGRLQASQVN